MPSCAADSWRYRSCNAAWTVLALRAPLREESRRRMKIVLAITAGVMVAEAAGGWLAHSLALIADAGHMLADVAALGLALVVTALAQRPVTAERTFGLLRLEILAALLNGAALIVIALGVGLEADTERD